MIAISLVMPMRNAGLYVDATLASLSAQDYPYWELWVVDDHSEDQGPERVRQWSRRDPRIQLMLNPGRGIIPALRAGEGHCTGKYISRMDADDLATPDRLSRMLRVLNEYGRGHVAVGLVRYFSMKGVSEGYRKYEYWLNELTINALNFSQIYKECVIPSPCWMMYREDFERIGGFHSREYPEDYDLSFRMYRNGLRVAPVRRFLHWWRDYPERTSRTSDWYAQNSFLNLKLRYYLELDYQAQRPLIIWGAGRKGKQIAGYLSQSHIPFHWICDNPRKWDKIIHGQRLKALDEFDQLISGKSIVAVANPDAQRAIRAFMTLRGRVEFQDYHFFC